MSTSSVNTEQASQIISRLSRAFHEAIESGHLKFFTSTVHRHTESGIEFQLRLCPALQNKQTPDKRTTDAEKRDDPFAPPYLTQLYVGDIQDDEEGYAILLNKFSVVPKHFLLVTKEYCSQTAPLSPSDLFQSYLILLAARHAGESYMAFYNCGNASGASQPHKHIQFLPVEDSSPVENLARMVNIHKPLEPFVISQLPYAHGIIRFPSHLSSLPKEDVKHTLLDGFLKLLDFAIMTTRHNPDQQPGPPSYNVILTSEHLLLVPRSKEAYTLKTGEFLSVNSLGFSGMMLVKSDEELGAVKREGVLEILKSVGMNKSEEDDSTLE